MYDRAPALNAPRAGWVQPAAGTTCNATGGGSVAPQRTASVGTSAPATATVAAPAPCPPMPALPLPWLNAGYSLPRPACSGVPHQAWQCTPCRSACNFLQVELASRHRRYTYCHAFSSTEGMATAPSGCAPGKHCNRNLSGCIPLWRKGAMYTRSHQLALNNAGNGLLASGNTPHRDRWQCALVCSTWRTSSQGRHGTRHTA